MPVSSVCQSVIVALAARIVLLLLKLTDCGLALS